MNPNDDRPVARRRLFRLGLSQLIRPLASVAHPLTSALEKLNRGDSPAASAPPSRRLPLNVWLRPPGALAEQKFLDTCSRCGKCVSVCPVNAIHIDSSAKLGKGFPFIAADTAACVVCQGLQCMHYCPSGAIVPTSINDIDMGTALWLEETCVRGRGENCRICVDHCPLGSTAIEIKNGAVAVNPLGCIGCGVCQRDCPTSPKSIVVIPIAAKTAPA